MTSSYQLESAASRETREDDPGYVRAMSVEVSIGEFGAQYILVVGYVLQALIKADTKEGSGHHLSGARRR